MRRAWRSSAQRKMPRSRALITCGGGEASPADSVQLQRVRALLDEMEAKGQAMNALRSDMMSTERSLAERDDELRHAKRMLADAQDQVASLRGQIVGLESRQKQLEEQVALHGDKNFELLHHLQVPGRRGGAAADGCQEEERAHGMSREEHRRDAEAAAKKLAQADLETSRLLDRIRTAESELANCRSDLHRTKSCVIDVGARGVHPRQGAGESAPDH